MKGAVFHTSAMIITIIAWGSEPSHGVSVPSTLFTNPIGDSKIDRHMIAVTTVSTAHGTSTTVRSRPLPRNAECIASAMASPRTVSSGTEAPVKMNVFFSASQNSGSLSTFS